MICSPAFKIGSEKSNCFARSGVMAIAAMPRSAFPDRTSSKSAPTSGTTWYFVLTCILSANLFHNSMLNPVNSPCWVITKGVISGKYQELKDLIADLSDYDIWRLDRGGHDAQKVYAAYAAAVKHQGQPTVILAKTVKGYGMGEAGEGQNITHQQKKMGEEALRAFRDRFKIPVPDDQVDKAPYYRPADDSPEIKYIRERRQALGGYLPQRRPKAEPLQVPDLSAFDAQLKSSGDREFSTTMAFVRILTTLVRDKQIGKHVVPIVADEARTFGMEGLFRQLGIYSSEGQLYRPEDSEQLMYYREDKKGQILEEGISEAGAFSSWTAAGTAYSTHGISMIPFYIYYTPFTS